MFEFLKNNNKKVKSDANFKEYDDVFNILPNKELKRYIQNYLIEDNNFIQDVDLVVANGKLNNLTKEERVEYFDNNIGNESRTYIYKILTLKHLSKILYKNVDVWLDEYWKQQLNKLKGVENMNNEYTDLLGSLLENAFPGKTAEEIANLPVESILNNPDISVNTTSEVEFVISDDAVEAVKQKTQEANELYQKINEVASQETITISKLQRVFCISYPKSAKIVDKLIEDNILERQDSGYKVLNSKQLALVLWQNLK